MPLPTSPVYQRLDNEKEEEYSNESESLYSPSGSSTNASNFWRIRILSAPGCFLLCNLILFCFSLLILLGSILHVNNLSNNVNNSLLKKTSVYSPIFDKLDMPITTIRTNGSFWPQRPPSIFQLPPSPEVDEAWGRISDTHGIVLTREEVINLGRDPMEQWRYPEEYGYGDDAYMGLLDVFHQLHCLNELRMAANADYYYNKTLTNPHQSRAGKIHFTRHDHNLHCQYILLQFIMCHADVSVITFNRVEGIRGPMADFSINHKCREFDQLLQWKLDHQVNVTDEEWQLIDRVPEGIRVLPGEGRAWPFE